MYNMNNYGEIVNGHGTFEQAAFDLSERGHVVLNWTDERGTVLNILLSYAPTRVGSPGGCVDSSGLKLWVGVALHGMFGFKLGDREIHWVYVAEKLGFTNAVTGRAVAKLISGVLEQLVALD